MIIHHSLLSSSRFPVISARIYTNPAINKKNANSAKGIHKPNGEIHSPFATGTSCPSSSAKTATEHSRKSIDKWQDLPNVLSNNLIKSLYHFFQSASFRVNDKPTNHDILWHKGMRLDSLYCLADRFVCVLESL